MDVVSRPVRFYGQALPPSMPGIWFPRLNNSDYEGRQHESRKRRPARTRRRPKRMGSQVAGDAATNLNGLPANALDGLKLLPSSREDPHPSPVQRPRCGGARRGPYGACKMNCHSCGWRCRFALGDGDWNDNAALASALEARLGQGKGSQRGVARLRRPTRRAHSAGAGPRESPSALLDCRSSM